jgi:hypothetical protein
MTQREIQAFFLGPRQRRIGRDDEIHVKLFRETTKRMSLKERQHQFERMGPRGPIKRSTGQGE